ncbi:cupin domain-containing protein [Geothermobacter hydrogeniphilus]|uniref:Cupin n=1 Tax=Geothermobacter hydrogeniphilus TaxID=1969733 RepID=A0A1X0YE96_9BACT|nr:cupin domain-containing protein [Geothermobacter hydrogeniphilus]ORJ63422.1 cupin [Geothermobacter hydrogeniphilus]
MNAKVLKLADVPKTGIPAGTKTSMQMLLSPDETPNFAMRCFTIEAGGSMPNHTNSVEHEKYVLSGTAEVSIGGERLQVNAGDVVFIPAGVPHWYRTLGDEPFRFLCLVPNQPDTIELVTD